MMTDLCERSHSVFIKGSEQRVIFLTEPISNDLYAKAQLEPDDDPDKTLVLTKMSRKQENSRIVTRITPYGAGSDKLAAPTIRACPTDIDAELFAEGFTLDRDENMVINYALESQLGYQVHETVPFPHVHQLRGGTGPNRITARELAQVAKSWLLEHNREEYFIYTAECLNWNEAEFGLARSCRVQYDLTRNDGTVYESIDEDLVIAEVTWEPDNEGTNIYSIKFSRNLAPIPTEEYRDAQATRNDRRRAMHPQPISKYTVVGGVDAVGAAATPAGGSGSVSGDLAKHIAENVDAHLIPEQIDAKIETHDALETAHNIPGQIADHAADPDSHHSQLHSVGDPVHHDAGTLMPWDWLSKAGSSLAHLASRLISDTTGSLLWGRVDKTGSQLSDLQSRPHSSLTSVSEDQHHSRQHSVTDANDHAMGGADGDVLMRIAGAPGLHTPSADVRGTAVEKLIKSTAEGESALEKLVATLAEISAFQSHLIPDETDTYDIGSVIKLWRQAFISELNAVLFVENSASAIGGWFIIPHGQGTLGEDVSDSETAIDFGGHLVEVGDFILLRGVGAGGPQVEYMRIDSLSGGNVWNVTRNLDGTGANEWPEGHVFIVLGQTGDGRIELDAQNGGPRISMITQGAAYNAQTEIVRVGDLNNWGPFVAETYGWSVGDYTSGNYAYYDGTKLEVRGLLKILGDSSFDGVVSISAAGEIRQGVGTVGADFTGLRIRHDGTQGIGLIELYLDGNIQVQTDTQGRLLAGGGLVVLDEDGLTITSAGTVWQNLGTPLEGASQAQTNATKLRFLDLIGNSNAEIFAESRSEYNYGSDLPIASKADLTLVARFIDNGNGTIYQVPLGPNIKLITEDETGYEYAAIEVSGDDAAGRIKMRLADGVQFFYADGLFSSLTERGRVFWNSDTEHTGKLTIKHEGESLVIQHVDDSGITARNWLSFKLANGTRIGYLGNGSSSGTSMYLLADAGNALYLGGNGNVRAMVYNGLAVGLTNDPGAGAIHAKNILKVGDGTGSLSLTIDKDDTGLGGIYFQNEGVNQLILRLDSSEDLEFNTRNNDGSYRTVLMKLYRESDFVFIRDLLVGN
ncbi:MAG: hypothetical protein KDE51_04285, partial [Anaerolineales bacterium]|nr:hypothetical protein [Anaerolineales bacterium]